jgi:6-pyruvoyltetrahydropterin/6-carboxytetrahydropterin synthase
MRPRSDRLTCPLHFAQTAWLSTLARFVDLFLHPSRPACRMPSTPQTSVIARLARTVRFGIAASPDPVSLETPRDNTHVGWPSLDVRTGGSWAATVEVEGVPDARTGYLVGIDRIDKAVREVALPRLLSTLKERPLTAIEVVRMLHDAASATLSVPVAAVSLRIEPLTAWRLESDAMTTPIVQRRYEFSASHRLHLADLDDEANRAMFGKCSNPNGHGHNYEVEVQVAFEGDPLDGAIHRLDAVVDRVVIERFDHKHLNLDLDDFRDRIPSVENITARCIELLREPVAAIATGARLHAVTVWETPRTACTIHA